MDVCVAGFSTSSVDLLVVDEAHRIQNPKAKQSVAVAGVGMAASARILVTATPLANNLAEFGALLQHAQPGLLGDVTGFDACFAQPFEAGRARGASEQAKAAMRLAADGVKQLRESLTLRRTRAQLQNSAAPWGLLLARSADCSLAAAAAPSAGGTRASPVRDGEVHGSPASPTSTSDTRSTAMCASMASEKAPSEPIENTVCA